MRNRLLTLLFLVAVMFAPAAGAADTSSLPVQNASTVRQAGTPVASPQASPTVSSPIRGYIVGDPNAPVTVTIWSDYQCGHCRAFHHDVLPEIIDAYVSTGKVKLQVFDLPVIGVKSLNDLGDDSLESVQAAEATMCAAEQDAYLPYSNRLMDGDIEPNSGAFSDEKLIGFAKDLELDVDRFTTCLTSGTYEPAVIGMVNQGLDAGVQGTPAIIVNDGSVMYGPDTAELSKAIDAALEK